MLKGVKYYRGRKNGADAQEKLKIGIGEGIAYCGNRSDLRVLSY